MTAFIDDYFFRELSAQNNKEHSLVFKLLPAALATIPFHANTPAVNRYVAAGFPLHLAVHEVPGVVIPPAQYTEPHIHDDHDEINIILSETALTYRIQLGDEHFIVASNSSIWIPKGMVHSANVLSGSGYFITIRI